MRRTHDETQRGGGRSADGGSGRLRFVPLARCDDRWLKGAKRPAGEGRKRGDESAWVAAFERGDGDAEEDRRMKARKGKALNGERDAVLSGASQRADAHHWRFSRTRRLARSFLSSLFLSFSLLFLPPFPLSVLLSHCLSFFDPYNHPLPPLSNQHPPA